MPVAAERSVAAGNDGRAADGLEKGQEGQASEEESRLKKAVFNVTRGSISIICEVHNPAV
jgi:hypothetical protein